MPQAKAVIYVGTNLQSARASRGEEPLLEVIETGISIVAMGGMTYTMDGAEISEGSAEPVAEEPSESDDGDLGIRKILDHVREEIEASRNAPN